MNLSSSGLYVQMLRFLAEPALRVLAMAALAGGVLALGRARDAAVRLAVWTAVLYAALAMPFLAQVAPAVRVPLPTRQATPSVPTPTIIRMPVAGSPVGISVARVPPTPQRIVKLSSGQPTFAWPRAAATLYLLIAGVLLAQLAVGFSFRRRVKLSSRPVEERRVLAMLLEQTTRWGLEAAPELAESPAVAVPITLGVRRPIILLPTAWRTWSEAKIHVVLAHELSHVLRRDALTRTLAAIHRSVFWFSPLAWWLERHLAALAEQASDDAALRTGADRIFYAKILLGFYGDMQGAAGRVRWEGMAMTSGKHAQRRVDRILDSSRRLSAGLRKPAWAALALLATPVIYLLAGVEPIAANKLPMRPTRAPIASLTGHPLLATMQAPPASPPPPAPAPQAPPEPAPTPAPAPKAPPPPPSTFSVGGLTYTLDLSEDWAVTSGEALTASGTFHDSDLRHIKALRRASNGDIIWFRRDGKSYIIRDAATVQQAKAILAPQDAFFDKVMEDLKRQQHALSAQQEKLAKQMEQVRVAVPDLTADLQKLQAQLDRLHKQGATQEELSDLQGALGDLQGKISQLQGAAGGELGALGGKQGELGAQQEKLGEKQEELGEQQARLAQEASKKMKALLDEALAKGLAQPE